MKRVLVTGANGFVGKHLCNRLLGELIVRGTLIYGEPANSLLMNCEPVFIQPIGPDSEWCEVLHSVDIVVHLAARVHIMQETSPDPLEKFCKVNSYGVERLAQQAAQAGVKRFIFMSTIGVNGDISGDNSYTERDCPHPHNPYSISKYEAELALQRVSQETGMEIVIIRAPIVYGPGNPGNFLSLLRVVSKGLPLPFSSITNKRSLIYVGNLVDALAICADHPAAAGKTYLVSDGEDVSTPELIRRTAAALNVPARLFSAPVSLMKLAAKVLEFGFDPSGPKWILDFGLFGSKAVKPIQNSKFKIHNRRFTGAVSRLTESLTVDSSKIRLELGWVPPFTMEKGLAETARWFLNKFEI